MFSLLLDSRLAKLQRSGANQKSHDFKIIFEPPVVLDSSRNYEAALDHLINMSYSWYNVAEKYGNNQFRWRKTVRRGKR